jgi:hypothetical protein
MTTPNGGRITAHVEGTVESANERGLRLDGESDWRNFSKWTPEPITPPRRGATVRLGLDASGFVRELQVIDEAPPSASSSDRTVEIRRLACLKAAATFCGGKALNTEVSSADVLKIAEAFERWVTREPSDG